MNKAGTESKPVTKTPCSPTATEEKQKIALFRALINRFVHTVLEGWWTL